MKNFWKEHNISQILLSLIMAVVIWAFAINELDPSKELNFSAIPVTFTGMETLEENNLAVIEGQDSTLRVSVEGTVKAFKEFDPKNIAVSVDLSAYLAPGEYQIPSSKINVSLQTSSLKVSSFTPRTLNITIDRITSCEFPVTVEVVGTPAAGYRYLEPELSMDHITVTGPETMLDQINEVLVNVEANTLSESMVYTAPIVFMDADQNVIESEFLSPEVDSIDVTIRTNKESEIPLRVDILPSDTLRAEDVTVKIEPETIPVFADESVLKNYPAITLGEIDLKTLNLSGVYTFQVSLPSRLTAIGKLPDHVEVTVEVKDQLTRQFTITAFDLKDVAQNPATVELETKSVVVNVTGVRSFVESLTEEDISVSLSYDSSILGMGEHELQAQVSVAPVGNYELSSDTVTLTLVLSEDEMQEELP